MSDYAKIAITMAWVYGALVWIGYMWGYRRGRVDADLGWKPPWYSKDYSAKGGQAYVGVYGDTKRSIIKGAPGTGGQAVE